MSIIPYPVYKIKNKGNGESTYLGKDSFIEKLHSGQNDCDTNFIFASIVGGQNVKIDPSTSKDPNIFVDAKWFDVKPFSFYNTLRENFKKPEIILRNVVNENNPLYLNNRNYKICTQNRIHFFIDSLFDEEVTINFRNNKNPIKIIYYEYSRFEEVSREFTTDSDNYSFSLFNRGGRRQYFIVEKETNDCLNIEHYGLDLSIPNNSILSKIRYYSVNNEEIINTQWYGQEYNCQNQISDIVKLNIFNSYMDINGSGYIYNNAIRGIIFGRINNIHASGYFTGVIDNDTITMEVIMNDDLSNNHIFKVYNTVKKDDNEFELGVVGIFGDGSNDVIENAKLTIIPDLRLSDRGRHIEVEGVEFTFKNIITDNILYYNTRNNTKIFSKSPLIFASYKEIFDNPLDNLNKQEIKNQLELSQDEVLYDFIYRNYVDEQLEILHNRDIVPGENINVIENLGTINRLVNNKFFDNIGSQGRNLVLSYYTEVYDRFSNKYGNNNIFNSIYMLNFLDLESVYFLEGDSVVLIDNILSQVKINNGIYYYEKNYDKKIVYKTEIFDYNLFMEKIVDKLNDLTIKPETWSTRFIEDEKWELFTNFYNEMIRELSVVTLHVIYEKDKKKYQIVNENSPDFVPEGILKFIYNFICSNKQCFCLWKATFDCDILDWKVEHLLSDCGVCNEFDWTINPFNILDDEILNTLGIIKEEFEEEECVFYKLTCSGTPCEFSDECTEEIEC